MEIGFIGCIILHVVSAGFIGISTAESNDEKRLLEHVMCNYDVSARPVINASDHVTVIVGVRLISIMDLEEKKQTLKTSLWVEEEWVDETLIWDPADYGGRESLILPATDIWTPDLFIFNNADKGDQGFLTANKSRAMVSHTGLVKWTLPLIVKSSCAVDVSYFPFDLQKCFIQLGSWIYDGQQVDLVKKSEQVDLSMYSTNSEFDLTHVQYVRSVKAYNTKQFPCVTMSINIQRKPLYYSYSFIAPTLVMCIMTLFSFFLPCDHGAKVAIGLTVFLSLYVLQKNISQNVPESNSVPLIGLFLLSAMTLNAVSLIVATLVINVKKKGDREGCPRVPRFILMLCRTCLAKLTCSTLLTSEQLYRDCDDDDDDYDVSADDTRDSSSCACSEDTHEGLLDNEGPDYAGASVEAAEKYLEMISRKRRDSDVSKSKQATTRAQNARLEWYFVAEVLDKMLFMIYLTGMILTVTVILFIVPRAQYDNETLTAEPIG